MRGSKKRGRGKISHSESYRNKKWIIGCEIYCQTFAHLIFFIILRRRIQLKISRIRIWGTLNNGIAKRNLKKIKGKILKRGNDIELMTFN